jgi:hypothetical protein
MSTRIMRLVAQPRRSRRALSCVSSSRPHSAENSVSQVDPNKESTSQSASVTCHSGSKAPCHCAERADLRGWRPTGTSSSTADWITLRAKSATA